MHICYKIPYVRKRHLKKIGKTTFFQNKKNDANGFTAIGVCCQIITAIALRRSVSQ